MHLCPMKLKYCVTIIFLLSVFACGKKERVKGIIYERRKLAGNRLVIHYKYQFENVFYKDSSIINNAILPLDTIDVFVDQRNPEKSLPDVITTGKLD